MMSRISAGSNLSIEVRPDEWLLLANGSAGNAGIERILVEAKIGQPLRYLSAFAAQRRLPGVELETRAIDRVVLGWSAQDQAWHLGLMLQGDLAAERGSRWCEIAHWPDAYAEIYGDQARRAGETLAYQIGKPFVAVPPNPPARSDDELDRLPQRIPAAQNQAAQRYVTPEIAYSPWPAPEPVREVPAYVPREPVGPPPPLPELPLRLDMWLLRPVRANGQLSDALELRLSPAWGRTHVFRGGWHWLWAGVFFILSVSTLTSPIALPRPEFLPYLGLASCAILIMTGLYNLLLPLFTLRSIIIDAGRQELRGGRGRRPRWQYARSQLRGIYVSQVVGRRRRKRSRAGDAFSRPVQHGELNLLLDNGKFFNLLVQTSVEESVRVPDEQSEQVDQVTPLTRRNSQTQIQHAGLYIAEALDLPSFYDQRGR